MRTSRRNKKTKRNMRSSRLKIIGSHMSHLRLES